MGLTLLTERHESQIAGVLGCWDRVLIFGTLPKICYAEGMTSYLYERQIRIFDYPRFAEPFRNELRENAERLATENGIEIEFLRKRNVRKEDLVKEIPGYLGMDHAQTPGGLGITVGYFRDADALTEWRSNAEHRAAQKRGQAEWYQSYTLHVAKVERSHGFTRP